MSIQEISWNNFRAKLNDREQTTFEWLCYLLFCHEFNQPTGMFRYKNHAGIETDPVKIEDESVGWQARFYDTRLSEQSLDLAADLDEKFEVMEASLNEKEG